jgi:hypothetical protein
MWRFLRRRLKKQQSEVGSKDRSNIDNSGRDRSPRFEENAKDIARTTSSARSECI